MKKFITGMLAVAICAALSACGGRTATPSSSDAPELESDAPVSSNAPDAPADQAAKGDPDKKAILVVSFGTSYNDSRDATIGAVEKAIQAAYPNYEVRRAFTSQIIIDKLKKRDNLEIDNVTEAMERLVADGVGTVICQPTHIMNGFEYDDMMREVGAYAGHFETLRFGKPLLTSTQDYKDIVAAITKEIPVPEGSALVMMGHGTEHFANSAYAALSYHLLDNGVQNVFVGTVEGYPDLEDTLRNVRASGVSRVILTPLMVVAGDHANNDMAGDEEGSWKTRFKAEGYEVEPVLKGLGEYESIRALYVAHVGAAINEAAE